MITIFTLRSLTVFSGLNLWGVFGWSKNLFQINRLSRRRSIFVLQYKTEFIQIVLICRRINVLRKNTHFKPNMFFTAFYFTLVSLFCGDGNNFATQKHSERSARTCFMKTMFQRHAQRALYQLQWNNILAIFQVKQVVRFYCRLRVLPVINWWNV